MNQKEIEERREELFTKLGSKLTTAHSEWDQLATQLDGYQETVEEIENQYLNLPEEKRQGFATSLNRIITSVADTDSPTAILDTKDDLEEAYENPLINSVQETYIEFYAELDVELTEDQENEVQGKLRATAESQPEQTLQETNRLMDRVSELVEPVVQALQKDIGETPTNITNPERLNDYIDTLENRHAILMSLADRLSGYAWAPEALGDIHTWDSLLQPGTDIEVAVIVETIDEDVKSTPDIVPLESALNGELRDRLEEAQSQPRAVFKDVAEGVSNIAEKTDMLSEIQALSEIIDFESEGAGFMTTVEGWQKSPPGRLEPLQQSVQTATKELIIWQESLNDQWHSKQPILSTYQEILDEGPPKKVVDYMGRELPIEENIARSYSALIQARSWISEKEEEVLEHLSEDAQQIFHALSEQRMYDITEDELDALAELMDVVNIKVVMDE